MISIILNGIILKEQNFELCIDILNDINFKYCDLFKYK